MNARNDKIVETLNKRQTGLTVLMDEVHKPHNLAAVVRTCDAVGIGDVNAVYPKGMIKSLHGTSMGSNRWVATRVHEDLDQGFQFVKAQKMQVLAAHFSDKAVDYRDIDYTKPTAILLGAEKFGVSAQGAEMADQHVIIPMMGMVQSLNVSVAAAIILYEAQRQRQQAGLYQQRQISDELFEKLRFEWLHPKVTKFCKQHNIRYPKINEIGDIKDKEWDQIRKSVNQ
ncbi:MAG: tRNA (guanosine(18)-2'-O)-methyltransferase TrmH [Gammaproteobacteria bacterium]|nr:tRNA (guanosine(18)-2'-O)-methyltransferase TrmH [Gammaproteobacteria bacterium]MDH5630502.1 tRNA (guanosine(18)-2'-O)-methyltransferase TrmH [Gammaproteobacteria bacterium]